ncbi:hypothetical protein OsI_36625 [Oryza sativa Indica Group]|uniref:Uncharacterized protein n=1 Tax=Oryza sativa subsp. indica TaxID=39946 RepID=B8BL96_ORYSI|nr:hypothetical protein OsI_36625 [Oryza sativa Indica Group]
MPLPPWGLVVGWVMALIAVELAYAFIFPYSFRYIADNDDDKMIIKFRPALLASSSVYSCTEARKLNGEASRQATNSEIRENACNGVHVENLIDEYVSTVEDVNEILMKGCSSNGFNSSRTSRITFVDLAGPDNDELDGGSKHCTREER